MKLQLLFALFFLVGAQLDAAPNRPRPWPKTVTEMKWKICENSFRDFQRYRSIKTGRYLIPKIAHFIVLDDDLSTEQLNNIERFRRFHPTWQIRIWTEESLSTLTIINKQVLDNTTSVEERAAIIRCEVLSNIGGVCLSPTYKCLRPLDELHQSCEFFTVCSNIAYKLSPDVIGARPHHPIIMACQRDVAQIDSSPLESLTNNFLRHAFKLRGRAVALPEHCFPTDVPSKGRAISPFAFAFEPADCD